MARSVYLSLPQCTDACPRCAIVHDGQARVCPPLARLAVAGGLLLSLLLYQPAAARQTTKEPAPPSQAASQPPQRSARPPVPPLSDLDRALLEDLPPTPPPSAAARPQKPAPQAPQPPAATPNTPSPPTLDLAALQPVAQKMLDVKDRLEKLDTSPSTQQSQAQIIERLRQLLGPDAADDSAAGQASSADSPMPSQAAPSGGAAQSAEPGGAVGQARAGESTVPAGALPALNPQQLAPRLWGHLPEKLREEMQSALGESFVPKYERLIEQYYRRLAEQPPSRP